jgi:hypothetical protein
MVARAPSSPSRGSSARSSCFFLLGAASTKDFSDMEGDRAGGCRTLPIASACARRVDDRAVVRLPWLLMPVGARLGILTGNATSLDVLGSCSRCGASYTLWLIVRNPDD